jgi:hypothetical protein
MAADVRAITRTHPPRINLTHMRLTLLTRGWGQALGTQVNSHEVGVDLLQTRTHDLVWIRHR